MPPSAPYALTPGCSLPLVHDETCSALLLSSMLVRNCDIIYYYFFLSLTSAKQPSHSQCFVRVLNPPLVTCAPLSVLYVHEFYCCQMCQNFCLSFTLAGGHYSLHPIISVKVYIVAATQLCYLPKWVSTKQLIRSSNYFLNLLSTALCVAHFLFHRDAIVLVCSLTNLLTCLLTYKWY